MTDCQKKRRPYKAGRNSMRVVCKISSNVYRRAWSVRRTYFYASVGGIKQSGGPAVRLSASLCESVSPFFTFISREQKDVF